MILHWKQSFKQIFNKLQSQWEVISHTMTISRSGARWSGSNRFRTSSSLMPLNLSIFLFFFTVVWSVIFSCTIFFGLPAFFFGEFPVALNTQKQTINLEHNNKVKQYKQAFHLFISAVWSIYNSTVITCLVIEIMVNYYITFFHKMHIYWICYCNKLNR